MKKTVSAYPFHVHPLPPAKGRFHASCITDGKFLTAYRSANKITPCALVLELPVAQYVYGFRYFPLCDEPAGRVQYWAVHVSDDGVTWGEPIMRGKFEAQFREFWPMRDEHYGPVFFPVPRLTRFVKFVAETSSDSTLTVADFQLFTDTTLPEDMAQTFALLKGKRMAPSVHLRYDLPPAQAFYNEMTILQSTPGSYFMACGFKGGYFGLQELEDGKKVLIFSVWDMKEDPNGDTVPPEQRTRCEYKDKCMRVGRFGGEGTGGQSFMDFDWKIGRTYKFRVESQMRSDNRIEFTAFFFLDTSQKWLKLITFSSPLIQHPMIANPYSFIEDFKRDWKSFKIARSALFSNTAVLVNNAWHTFDTVRFTKDINPNNNVDCAVASNGFTLTTGGLKTRNKAQNLFTILPNPNVEKWSPPKLDSK